jgi:hypothetical protein
LLLNRGSWLGFSRPARPPVQRLSLFAAASLLAGIFVLPIALEAQQSSTDRGAAGMVSRLPEDVLYYVHWHGTKTIDVAKSKNGLVRLWSDPDFATLRHAMMEHAVSEQPHKDASGEITAEQATELLPLFENEAIAGGLPAQGPDADHSLGHNTFFIYDVSGKEQLAATFDSLMKKRLAEGAQPDSYMLGEVKIESIASSKGHEYLARAGKYWLSAAKKEIIESLVTRFGGSPPATSLMNDAAWKGAQQSFTPGALADVFVRLSGKSLDFLGKKDKFDAAAFADAVHLERFRAATLSLSLGDDATRLRTAIIGDTSPGSLFEVVGASSPNFATLPLAGVGTSYSVTRFNFLALYKILTAAIFNSVPAKESATLKGFEAFGGAILGMPIADALALLGEEQANISPHLLNANDRLFAISIRNREDFSKVLHKGLGTMIRNERQDGDATIFELGKPATAPARGPAAAAPADPQFSYIALTPQLLIYSQRKEMVEDALARLRGSQKSETGSLSNNPDFQRARGLLPANLSGFAYTQMTKETWEHASEALRRMANARTVNKSSPNAAPGAPQKDWLKDVNLEVFSRYLHSYTSGSWKTSDGVYFDSYLQ